jgi:hypothetical protein
MWEHGGEVKQSVPDSGDVLWSDQEVRAQREKKQHQRVEMCYGWSGEVQNVGAEWRSAHGCTIVWICIFVGPGGVVVDCSGEGTLMHRRVEMHYNQSRREQEFGALHTSEEVSTR